MTYPELTEKVYKILNYVFNENVNEISEALSLEESLKASAMDKIMFLGEIEATFDIHIYDAELDALYAHDGGDGIMLISYINFFAKKLDIAIPSNRKLYEIQMRSLKTATRITAKQQTTKSHSDELTKIENNLKKIGDVISQYNHDYAKREKILNHRIRYKTK